MTQPVRPEHSGVRERNRAWSATLLTTACVLATATGCSSGKTDDPKETPSPSASAKQTPSKPADPNETAKNEAVATYKQYWQAMERLYADSSGKDNALKDYAAGAALKNAEADAKNMHGKGRIITGQVAVGSPTVTSADINRKIPNATISSCLDISHWQVIDSATKKPAALPSTRLTKYVIVSTVERWPEGWRVIKDEPQGQKC
ncbi:hypothetical protein OOK13_43250 [Streptomyces sp. NBC_00378]|uniref:hypothetical protein n=1 Tax=unclassified Streptomyces TaxID=2593676 RepID=UPI0022561204|nr:MULTISPECIES: hypothetical protein [unclassified Streptomyces]MCX5115147.1 hypothetical protein [Streptomyces sp. NBC_00378]